LPRKDGLIRHPRQGLPQRSDGVFLPITFENKDLHL